MRRDDRFDSATPRVCSRAKYLQRRTVMPLPGSAHDEARLEECLDELGELVNGLDRYPLALLAGTMRVHLAVLLQALLDGKICRAEEVRDFIRELERDALQY